MKMMVGMGSIDDYFSYAQAGAGEIFVGYVPEFWMKKYGMRSPLNRREVFYYNVQIGSYSELLILSDMVKKAGIKVSITLNALHYDPDSYEDLFRIMESCMAIGFHSFIVADPAFLTAVFEKDRTGMEIIVSGEYGEINEEILAEFCRQGVKRIIFPRQTSLSEMEELIEKFPQIEYEAFTLNEKCHFSGAYCNSVHCDEFCHMCKVPYRMDGHLPGHSLKNSDMELEDYEILGMTGCALCALWDYRRIGVTHLKIVSRGNGSESTEDDIKKVEEALSILKDSHSRASYIHKMKERLFPQGCSHNCYVSLPDRI